MVRKLDRRNARLAILVATIVGVSACRTAPPPRSPHLVRYRLDWSWESTNKSGDARGWETINNLGYRIRVTRGYVVTYSMQLVECTSAETPSARLRDWFVSAAWAGHSSGTPDPASIRPMQVESLTAPSVLTAGEVVLTPQRYCQLHYLIARADNAARDLPHDVDMTDSSLHVDGSYTSPNGSEDKPFTIHMATAYGAMFDRAANGATALRIDTGAGANQVIVRRRLAKMFDGVDFDTMRPKIIANQTLKALVDHTQVEVEAIDAQP